MRTGKVHGERGHRVSLKQSILHIVNAPEDGVLSSQTLYECLLFLLEAQECQPRDEFQVAARRVASLIVESQLPDGGFDIGYNFRFGRRLEKSHPKEGTTPEVLSLTSLALYHRVFFDDAVLPTLQLGLNWIRRHLLWMEDRCAVPYAPLTSSRVHITNATSFALSAMATSAAVLDCRDLVEKEIQGMYLFMRDQLCPSSGGGSYWPYFHQTDELLASEPGAEKIDNYHMGQQLYHHVLAQRFFPSSVNLEIIQSVLDYLLAVQEEDGFIPYTVKAGRKSDSVDTWGFASTITGFMAAGEMLESERATIAGRKVADYLWQHAWADGFFYPIISQATKKASDRHHYPRSDAWVIHGLAMALRTDPEFDPRRLDRLFSCYEKISGEDFRGLENHTLTWRKRVFGAVAATMLSMQPRRRLD